MANAIRLDGDVAVHEYDDIFADPFPQALIATVELAAAEKGVQRGTVLSAKSADGQFAAITQALESGDVVFVSSDSIDKAEAGDVITVYKTGNFVRGRLLTDGEYEMVDADFEFLRDAGIQTTAMVEVLEGV